MTAELKQAAQIALLALEYHTQQTRPITQTEEAIKVLMEALAANQAEPSPAEAQELCERICAAIQAADDKSMAEAGYMLDCNDCCRIVRDQFAASNVQPKGTDVPQGPRTEFVLNELRSALSAMTTFFGMDEDEASKPTFDKARQALNYAEIVMRPLEPWERQSLEDFRACVHRWHEKAVAKGYDGVEAMCDTALPYGTRDLRLVFASPAPVAEVENLRRDYARALDTIKGHAAQIGKLEQHIRELRAFQAMVNRYAPEFPADPDAPRDVWYWQGDGRDHLESMVHQLPVVIRAEQLRELLAASQAPAVAHQPETAMPADNTFNTAFLKLQEISAEAGAVKGYWPGDSDRIERVVKLANEVIEVLMQAPSGDFTHEEYIALTNPGALKPLEVGFGSQESQPPVQGSGS